MSGFIMLVCIIIYIGSHLICLSKYGLIQTILGVGIIHSLAFAIWYFFDWFGFSLVLDFWLTLMAGLGALKSKSSGGGGFDGFGSGSGRLARKVGISAVAGYLIGKKLGKL